jgi:vancomycin resistance protein YoaR
MNRTASQLLVSTFLGLLLCWAQGASAASTLLKEVPVGSGVVARARTQPFQLNVDKKVWTISPQEFTTWFKTYSRDGRLLLQLRPGAIYNYLNTSVSPRVNDLGENSRFTTINGQTTLTTGGRKGSIVDGDKTSLAIRAALVSGKNSATVAMKEYRPAIFSVDDFKKLKFPDHLSSGQSNFAGSPRNRVHNIQTGTERYNGVIVMPGEEFSFNKYLGTVDAANNYLPELVIKENVTTPEYGGGICQVSTTAFRAAMEAGLKITRRQNHSYPVKYYGKPGYDATTYQPNPDLRFVNDLPKPILIQTHIEGTKLTFDVWGTSDGRQVTINGPFVTSKKPDGSLTAAVAQIIKKNGQSIREQNFVSHYQSPAKFPTVRKANGE